MEKILRHIEVLFLTSNSVCLPGIGKLSFHPLSAIYSSEEGRIYPPSRTFTFDPGTKSDDGKLAASIARKEEISIEKARNEVASEMARMKMLLESEGVLELGKFGTLGIDSEDESYFQPGAGADLAPEFAWLPETRIHPPKPGFEIISENISSPANEEAETRRNPILNVVWRYAASVAVVVCVAMAALLPGNQGRSKAFVASTGLEQLIARGDAMFGTDAEIEPKDLSNAPQVLIIVNPESERKNAESADMQNPEEESLQPLSVSNDSGRYCLVVASFGTNSDAQRYISERPEEENLNIVYSDGKYRIYIASSDNRADLETLGKVPEIKASYPGLWICRR